MANGTAPTTSAGAESVNICPHCGADNDYGDTLDYAEPNRSVDVLVKCDECERRYVLEVEVRVGVLHLAEADLDEMEEMIEEAAHV